MGCLDLRLKIGSYSKFFLALSHHGRGQKGGIIPLCSSPLTGLGEKGGIIPKHKGILGSLQFQENKERSCVTHNLHKYSTRSSD